MSNEWKASDHTAECASWRNVMVGGISMDVNQRPNAHEVRLPCDCRLAQPEPAACGHSKNACYDHICRNCGREWESHSPEPLARDMATMERFAMAAMNGMCANPACTRMGYNDISAAAINIADALLVALKEKNDDA